MYHLGVLDDKSLLLPFLLSLPIMILFLFKWFNHSPKNVPPSPPKLPIIGNLHQIITSTSTIPERCLESLAKKYGPVMLLHMGGKPVVIISSADAAKQVLQQHKNTFVERPSPQFVGRLTYNFRDVAFAPYGDYWRQVRNISTLHLLSNKMEDLHSINKNIRQEETMKMLEGIKQSCVSSGSVICMSAILTTLTSNIIALAVTGKRCLEKIDQIELKKLIADATMIAEYYFDVADYIPWLGWINHINGLEAKVKRVEKECHAYLDDIVEEGLKRVEKRMVNHSEEKIQKEHLNIVDILLDLYRGNAATGFSIDLDSIKAVIADMLLGGTSNISLLLESVILELLRNPSVMAKLQSEVRQFPEYDFKSNLRIIKEEDLEKLPYLRAVVKETLRFNPPSPLYSRKSQKSVKIEGYDIAPETNVVINAWAIGRNPLLWENAGQFLPERFLESPCDFRGQHFEFIPFGSGTRSCPAIGFTIPTVELALANLILNFDIESPGGSRGLEGLELQSGQGRVMRGKIPLLLVASLPNASAPSNAGE